ncbi:transcription factor E2F3-like isoform X2 [Scomber scombrus]|uniref:Transcription factor E2F3-like isoform X2 n=1 Tax=Scomber scombrus TaxID=13677 RepID=A0AAV1PGH8_SCOSC
MVKCVVAGCPNRQVDGTGTGTGEILSRTPKRFFSFPTDPARVKVWLAALRETGKQDPIGEHLICEDHFLPEDISSSEVTSDAIPIMPPDLDGSLGLSSSWRVESSEEEEQCATGGCDYDDDDDEGGEGDAPAAAAEPSAQDLPQQDQFGCFEDPPPEEDAKKTSPPKKIEPNQLKKATKRSVVPLETLTVRFLELLQATPNRSVDLLQAAKTLQIRKHRLINITNVLHDISFIRMKSANNIKWSASWPISSFLSEYNRATELENKQENEAELENLELVEDTLNGLIKSCTQELFNMTNDFKNAAYPF